jgi:menaquinone-dependent protoporphyrinogen oxidase
VNSKVLVTYATRMGSTEEVAQRVACKLRESGLAVDVLPARHVRSLESYGAVVLGAALYVGRLHKDARRFLAANRDLLIKLPVALFVLGPVQKDEKDWKGAQNQLEKQLRDFPWFAPVALSIVGGKFDAARLGFPFNLIPALRRMPPSDVRDWEAIDTFASELALQFSGVTIQ